jgi:uncharacterized protein YjbI with pentapeptide repeats
VDGGPIQFYGENGNSSHDKLLSENVPIELHNRSFKIEYIFPSTVRLDAPDSACQEQAVAFGVADMEFGTAVLRFGVAKQVWQWLSENPLKHDNTTLREADLRGANLREADLRGADLWRANLRGANLWGADLWGADLQEANLREANLREANLREANLWGANLRGANLWEADLQGADLWGADLRGADLREADLRGAVMPAGWTASTTHD